MTDKRKKRIRELAEATGKSRRGAANLLAKLTRERRAEQTPPVATTLDKEEREP